MSDNVTAIKGFADLFSPDSDAFTRMEGIAREIFSRYGFTELRTPILERTELFCRGIGNETDVVQKEMYTFPDRKGRSLTMRPEATAGVMRAYIESGRSADAVTKLFTIGPMFRYERPQKGRMRQFHQINCECLGPSEPYADAELVTMAMRFLEAIGLRNLTLQLNSLGCPSCRPAYRDTLRQWLSSLDESALCEDCRRRMVTNPLRVLDCKVPTCKEHTAAAPKILDHNCPDCAAHFDTVRRLLDAEKVPYVINHRLVRGLDYYTRTTFEIVSDEIGAQGTVAGGGRYDGLVAQLGGPNVPGFGFACGMERLALLLPDSEEDREAARSDFYVVVLADAARDSAYALTQALRDAGFRGEMGFAVRSVKSAMRQAGKSGARFCLLIGEDELAARTVMLKNMDSGEQASVAFADVVARLQK
ncbi:MAG: histidine--tRNA ligase [Bilophila sp.]